MSRYDDLPYRTCVGMMLINSEGLVFIGRRAGGPEHVDAQHVWQMPQGASIPVKTHGQPQNASFTKKPTHSRLRNLPKFPNGSPMTFRAQWRAAPGKAAFADRNKNGTRCASPARTARSTSPHPPVTNPNSFRGDGSLWKIFPN